MLLLIETSTGFARRLIQGVTAYARERGPWLLSLGEGGSDALGRTLAARERVDGVIARMESRAVFEQVSATGLPFVNVSGTCFGDDVPWVDVNNASVCRLIFQEFVRNSLQRFAFCGWDGAEWSRWRRDLFTSLVQERGGEVLANAIPGPPAGDDSRERERLIAWLSALPKPIGLMAANDACGYALLQACQAGGIAVPEAVAVIGVDNDELLCELSHPSLSSVSPNTETIGHRAAEALDSLMDGQRLQPAILKVEPLGVEARRSTGAEAGDAYFLRRALGYIQAHACEGINVQDVLKAVPLSRTSLENGLRSLIGRSPHAEIVRIRLESAKRLLSGSTLNLAAVAERCGYRNVDYFSAAFKRDVGLPPGEYRRTRGRP